MSEKLNPAAAGAASAAAPAEQDPIPMNALRTDALRGSAPHWSATAASFFSPPFRSRRCRCRRAPAPAAASRPARSARARAKFLMETEPRDPWLASLSLLPAEDSTAADAAPTGWAIGVDPDTGGAIAVLSPDSSSQVFDNPFVHIVVSEVIRKRLDTKSIIQLLRGLDVPPGTTAYIEKSSPFPTDGNLIFIWLVDRFSSGIWVFSCSGRITDMEGLLWLSRSESPKDDSRQAASILFPDKTLSLKLKKQQASRGSSVSCLRKRPDATIREAQQNMRPA